MLWLCVLCYSSTRKLWALERLKSILLYARTLSIHGDSQTDMNKWAQYMYMRVCVCVCMYRYALQQSLLTAIHLYKTKLKQNREAPILASAARYFPGKSN